MDAALAISEAGGTADVLPRPTSDSDFGSMVGGMPGYRSWGTDMTTEHDPYEAGLGFAVKPDKGDFVGRAALDGRSEATAARRLACLTLDDPRAVVMGKEPVLVDGRPAGYVTSAAFGYSVGRSIAYAWLPAAAATPGRAVEIEYFGEQLRAVVAAEPLFDREMARLRA
jgi:glycine cleavage system aminomethyltransferase T